MVFADFGSPLDRANKRPPDRPTKETDEGTTELFVKAAKTPTCQSVVREDTAAAASAVSTSTSVNPPPTPVLCSTPDFLRCERFPLGSSPGEITGKDKPPAGIVGHASALRSGLCSSCIRSKTNHNYNKRLEEKRNGRGFEMSEPFRKTVSMLPCLFRHAKRLLSQMTARIELAEICLLVLLLFA